MSKVMAIGIFIFIIIACCLLTLIVGASIEQETVDKSSSALSTPTPTLAEYRIVEEKDISYGYCDRVTLRVVVPDGTTSDVVSNTAKKIIDDYYSNWNDITVWLFFESDESYLGAYTAGVEEFSVCE